MCQRGPLSSFKSKQKFGSPIKIHNIISFIFKSTLVLSYRKKIFTTQKSCLPNFKIVLKC